MPLTQAQIDQLKADELAVEVATTKLKSDLAALAADPPVVVQPPPVVIPPPVVTPPPTVPAIATLTLVPPTVIPPGATTPQYVWPVPTAKAGQPIYFVLHGSSGQAYRGPMNPGKGHLYKLVGDASMDETQTTYCNVHDAAGYNAPNPFTWIYPSDAVYPPSKPIGFMETQHLGYTKNGFYSPYTEKRLRFYAEQLPLKYPQLDKTMMGVHGESKGAWGVAAWGMWQTDLFSYAVAGRPVFIFNMISDWALGTNRYPTVNDVFADGTSVMKAYDTAAKIADPKNKMIPFHFVIGANDGFSKWPDVLAAIKALKATRRHFSCHWNQGDHGTAPSEALISESYTTDLYRVGQPVPVFANSSIDQDPTKDPVGSINRGYMWRNLTATTGEFTNVYSDATVEIDWNGITKTVSLTKGVWALVDFSVTVPPPPTPTTPVKAQIVERVQPLGPAGFFTQGGWDGDRYVRHQNLMKIKKNSGAFFIWRDKLISHAPPFGVAFPVNLVFTPFLTPPGPLLGSDIVVATKNTDPKLNNIPWTFGPGKDVDLVAQGITEGWYLVKATAPGWLTWEYPVYVQEGDKAKPQAWMPVITGSHFYEKFSGMVPQKYHVTLVPTVYKPRTVALPVRPLKPLGTMYGRYQLAFEQVTPVRQNDTYRPSVDADGLWSTGNRQIYMTADWAVNNQTPHWWHLKSGPRGANVMGNVLMLKHHRLNRVWYCDPWGSGVMDPLGNAIRMIGWESSDPPSQWEDLKPRGRLLGDWSKVDATRRGFRELWDVTPVPSTVAVDPNATPINGEQPHGQNVVMLYADTGNNRMIVGTYAGNKNPGEQEPIVEEKLFDLVKGPFNATFVGNELWISEREGNRISMWDVNTWTMLRSFSGIYQPTGMAYQDGYMYVGSFPSRAIFKIDVNTLTFTQHATVPTDQNSHFVTVSIDPGAGQGGFLERGTILSTTFSNAQFTFPMLYKPDGTEYLMRRPGQTTDYPRWRWWDEQYGRPSVGGPLGAGGGGYPTAACFGPGWFMWGHSHEGINRATAADSTDKPLPTEYWIGRQQFIDRGYYLVHQMDGWSYNADCPLPFGETQEMDVYLKTHGHI